MIFTGRQCEQFLTTNGMGKPAQVGYDITVKSINKITGGTVGVSFTEPTLYTHMSHDTERWTLPSGLYSLTFHQGCKLPSNVKASIVHRSSVLRCGGIITSGIYDPGFEVEEMGAVLNVIVPMTIEVNARVAQFVAEECVEVSKEDLYNGQWQKDKDVK